MIFCTILETIVKSELRLKDIALLGSVAGINAICAMVIGLCFVNFFQPGLSLTFIKDVYVKSFNDQELIEKFQSLQNLEFDRFLLTPIPIAVAAAVVTGLLFLGLKIIRPPHWDESELWFKRFLQSLLEKLFWLMGKVVYLIPIAVFAGVAKATGLSGLEPFKGLIVYALVAMGGMSTHIFIVYQSWAAIGLRISLREFWRIAREPATYAFGINSSLATLPVTLRALKSLGVSDKSSRLSACLGTNFNNDGILLYEVVAVMALLQAFHIDIDFMGQVIVTMICLVATIGAAGVPEAGMMTLTLVVSTLGLPTEALPFLISIDWFVGRFRSLTNVLGDISVAIGIDKLQGGR
jgi:DAACS family dicarboxylate/amino acid:cation (Na+ or H+) symporter